MTIRRPNRSPAGTHDLFPALPAKGVIVSLGLLMWAATTGAGPTAAQEPAASTTGDQPTGEWILQKGDENMASGTKISRSRMIIEGRGGSRTVESQSWIRGTEESFTEYLSPPRDRGTKMLKLGDQLWTFFPSTDRTILIAGHMLRQSVMGSDLSYEDLMEDPHLFDMYSATILREEEYEGRACWVLRLEARDSSPAYHAREMWVDQERFVPTTSQDHGGRAGRAPGRPVGGPGDGLSGRPEVGGRDPVHHRVHRVRPGDPFSSPHQGRAAALMGRSISMRPPMVSPAPRQGRPR